MWVKELGCLIQINLFSAKQDTRWRRELANEFLKHHLIDLVGTDTPRILNTNKEKSLRIILDRFDIIS